MSRGDSEAEERFDKLIRGRRVLLVGGAMSDGIGEGVTETVGIDTVVQLKYFGGALGNWQGPDYGRVDIAYYISHAARKLEQLLSENSDPASIGLDTTSVVVFLDGPPRRHLPLAVCTHKLRFEFEYGTAQIGQRAAIDILSREPRELLLTGFDGYLTSQVEHSYRRMLSRRTDFFRGLSSFSSHDVIENRDLLISLWKTGRISVDQKVREYLDLTLTEYARRLDDSLRAQFAHR